LRNKYSILFILSEPSWSYGSWLYNYLCNQGLSPVCQWLATGWWFSLATPVFSTNKSGRHDITEILLKVVLNTITPNTNLPRICIHLTIIRKYSKWQIIDLIIVYFLGQCYYDEMRISAKAIVKSQTNFTLYLFQDLRKNYYSICCWQE
jgi:hypothetical protein